MDIAENVVEQLCISLIIPVVRTQTIRVLSHIMCSAQSKKLFLKMENRLPKAIPLIIRSVQDSDVPPDVQLLVDLVSVFVNRFPAQSRREEIVSIFFYYLELTRYSNTACVPYDDERLIIFFRLTLPDNAPERLQSV